MTGENRPEGASHRVTGASSIERRDTKHADEHGSESFIDAMSTDPAVSAMARLQKEFRDYEKLAVESAEKTLAEGPFTSARDIKAVARADSAAFSTLTDGKDLDTGTIQELLQLHGAWGVRQHKDEGQARDATEIDRNILKTEELLKADGSESLKDTLTTQDLDVSPGAQELLAGMFSNRESVMQLCQSDLKDQAQRIEHDELSSKINEQLLAELFRPNPDRGKLREYLGQAIASNQNVLRDNSRKIENAFAFVNLFHKDLSTNMTWAVAPDMIAMVRENSDELKKHMHTRDSNRAIHSSRAEPETKA